MSTEPRPVDAATSARTVERIVAERRARRARRRGDAAARRAVPRQRGPPDHRGLPGRRKDDARQGARALDRLHFSRIQFTPDLLPTDITGVNVFDQRTNEFDFRHGPVFANLLLVDEVNRASPKTQSALLECMQEAQVTVDGVSYELPRPFMVAATQNPIEYEGTYPLPEAQLDRFTMRLSLGYPPLAEEARMLAQQTSDPPQDFLEPVCTADGRARRGRGREGRLRRGERQPLRRRRAPAHARRSRLYLGASPRAGIALLRVAKARALAAGRSFVSPDDVKAVARARARAPADRLARGALRRALRRGPRPRGDREDARPGMTTRGRAALGLGVADVRRGLGVRIAAARRRRGRADARRASLAWLAVRLTARPVGAAAHDCRRCRSRATTCRSASSSSSSPRSRRPGSRSSSATRGSARGAPQLRARRQAPLGALRARRPCRAAATGSRRPSSSSRIPFGLERRERRARRSRRRSSSTRGSIELERLFSETGAHARDGRRLLLQRPSGFDLHSVRDYVEGDSLRKVHWRSTARRGQLMVKELEDSPRDDVAVVLDAWRGCPSAVFDVAVRAAGSILQAYARRSRRAALVLGGATRRDPARPGRGRLAPRARAARRRRGRRRRAALAAARGRAEPGGARARPRRRDAAARRAARRPARSSAPRHGATPRSSTSTARTTASRAASAPGRRRRRRRPARGRRPRGACSARPRSRRRLMPRLRRRALLAASCRALVLMLSWLRLEHPQRDGWRALALLAARASCPRSRRAPGSGSSLLGRRRWSSRSRSRRACRLHHPWRAGPRLWDGFLDFVRRPAAVRPVVPPALPRAAAARRLRLHGRSRARRVVRPAARRGRRLHRRRRLARDAAARTTATSCAAR